MGGIINSDKEFTLENFASKKAFRGQGSDVSIDYFLYSCFEHERFKKANQKAGEPPKPSPFAEQFSSGFQEASAEDLFDAIFDVVSWYKAQFPDFGAEAPLTLANINDVIPPFTALCRDFSPLFAAPAEEEGGADAQKAIDLSATPAWKAIEKVITSCFPRNHNFFLKFLYWTYVEKPEEADEVGSRPPLGRYSPYFRPGQSGPGRSGGSSGPRGRGGDKGGQRGDRGPRREKRDGHEPREFRGDGHRDRDGQGGREPREGQGGRDRQRGRNNQRRDGRGPSREGRDPRLEEESIAQVIQAAQYLRENPGIEEYRLPPTNSYYRLLQHQQVKKEGFFSQSVGEGPERALMMTRSGEEKP